MMNLLIAIDLSEASQRLLDKTAKLIQECQGTICLLHVADPDPDFVGYEIDPTVMRNQLAERFHREHRQLQELADGLRRSGADAKALLIQGPIVASIIRQAELLDADMIVVGSHGHGALHHLLLGGVSRGILRESPRPVLVVSVKEA
ncbi:MAG: universal stress protein [Methylococcaceae bacterium]|nr:universal stress protein [Methylococcaceae bacterium]